MRDFSFNFQFVKFLSENAPSDNELVTSTGYCSQFSQESP